MILRFLMMSCFGILYSSSALAQSQKTDIRPKANRVLGDDLLDTFKGITHDGAYNFNSTGRASNFYTETHHDDGRVTYSEGEKNYEGAWILRADGICYFYKDPAMNGGCFRVYKIKNCYYFYSKNLTEQPNELDRDYWTARSVAKGEEAGCEAPIS